MISDRELWACAIQVICAHGNGVEAFIIARLTELANVHDLAGVKTWKAIAARVEQLRDMRGLDKARQ